MSAKYRSVRRKDPTNPNAPAKYYPSMKIQGQTNLRELVTGVSEMSSLSTIDMIAAIEGLLVAIPKELVTGKSVVLGEFGTYYLTLHGKGVENSRAMSNRNIIQARARFRPGKLFNKALKGTQFQKERSPAKRSKLKK